MRGSATGGKVSSRRTSFRFARTPFSKTRPDISGSTTAGCAFRCRRRRIETRGNCLVAPLREPDTDGVVRSRRSPYPRKPCGSLTEDHDAVRIEAVFRAVLEALEHALRRPQHRAGLEPHRQRDFRPGVAVVAFPLPFAEATDGFAHIGAEPEHVRARS